MADTKLYRIHAGKASQIPGQSLALEKSLQNLIEENLESMMGIRFIASEHSTGKVHAGRIDTLGLDENNCPVVIEYKRSANETVINQGLFYLDWLMDHRAEFELLVLRKLGEKVAEKIDWDEPRLICVAGDYIRYDLHAVRQINRNIELLRFKRFGEDLLLLELVNSVSSEHKPSRAANAKRTAEDAAERAQKRAEGALNDLYEELKAFILALGDDVIFKELKHYDAFRRIRNFACVWTGTKEICVWLPLDPKKETIEEGFSRDVTDIGHWGSGDLEIFFRDRAGLEKAKPLILKAYQGG